MSTFHGPCGFSLTFASNTLTVMLKNYSDIGYSHIYHNYPRKGFKQDFDLPHINFPGDSSQPLCDFPILRNPQGEPFRNGVKLAQGRNPDRVIFRQVTGKSNKAEFVRSKSHASAKDNNLTLTFRFYIVSFLLLMLYIPLPWLWWYINSTNSDRSEQAIAYPARFTE